MRSRPRQRRRASNEKLAGAETMTSGASRTTFERNADSKFDAVLAGASWRGHAQIDPRADWSRLGKPGRLRRIGASVSAFGEHCSMDSRLFFAARRRDGCGLRELLLNAVDN
jgi:hypothetical protein